MYRIKDVTIPIAGTATHLQIAVKPFQLFPSTINVAWALVTPVEQMLPVILEGTLQLPEDVVSAWGSDDTIVLEYVVKVLGLELI